MCISILNGNGFAFENSLDSGHPFASAPARCTNRAVVWKKTSVLSIPGLAAGVPHLLMPLSLHTCSFQPSIWRYIAFIPVPVRRYYSPGEDDCSSWCSDIKHSLMVRTREQHHSKGQVQSIFAETSGVCCACLGCMLPTWHHCHGALPAVDSKSYFACPPSSDAQRWCAGHHRLANSGLASPSPKTVFAVGPSARRWSSLSAQPSSFACVFSLLLLFPQSFDAISSVVSYLPMFEVFSSFFCCSV